jgi:hypothetical protein
VSRRKRREGGALTADWTIEQSMRRTVRKMVDSGTQAGIHIAVEVLVSILAASLDHSSASSLKSGDASNTDVVFCTPNLAWN